jgi:hypothetical protein
MSLLSVLRRFGLIAHEFKAHQSALPGCAFSSDRSHLIATQSATRIGYV